MKRGLFITVEGGDGSGKSTQLDNIKKYLSEHGIPCVFTREPGGTAIGEKIREVILDPANGEMSDMTEALLYAASRAQIIRELVRPALESGKCVVCDRFVDSSIAYQGYGRGLGSAVEEINSYAIDGLMPDHTFFFDVSPEKAMERLAGRGKDRLEEESADFHRKVYLGYKAIAAKDAESGKGRVIVIDASADIDSVTDQVLSALDGIFGQKEER